jgi:hypothetical protein
MTQPSGIIEAFQPAYSNFFAYIKSSGRVYLINRNILYDSFLCFLLVSHFIFQVVQLLRVSLKENSIPDIFIDITWLLGYSQGTLLYLNLLRRGKEIAIFLNMLMCRERGFSGISLMCSVLYHRLIYTHFNNFFVGNHERIHKNQLSSKNYGN